MLQRLWGGTCHPLSTEVQLRAHRLRVLHRVLGMWGVRRSVGTWAQHGHLAGGGNGIEGEPQIGRPRHVAHPVGVPRQHVRLLLPPPPRIVEEPHLRTTIACTNGSLTDRSCPFREFPLETITQARDCALQVS